MTSVIIQHKTSGERQAVRDLGGYDEAEWDVLGVDREPLPNEEWDGSNWVLNQTRVDEQEEIAQVVDKRRLLVVLKAMRKRQKELIDAVQSLEARITTLEGN
jgi:hypothetical protein